ALEPAGARHQDILLILRFCLSENTILTSLAEVVCLGLAFGDQEFTLDELDALAAGLAHTLSGNGVRTGDRVALMASNRPEFVVAVRAIWRLGASVVLFSPAWKRGEVEHALAITQPRHAVGDHPLLAAMAPMTNLDDPITPRPSRSVEPDPDAD